MPRAMPDGPGKRYTLSSRLTHDAHTALKAAAKASGRSVSQEAEFRIEQSLRASGDIADAAEDRMRAIAREEMDRREAENAARSRDILMVQAVLGPPLNPVVPPSQMPKVYNY